MYNQSYSYPLHEESNGWYPESHGQRYHQNNDMHYYTPDYNEHQYQQPIRNQVAKYTKHNTNNNNYDQLQRRRVDDRVINNNKRRRSPSPDALLRPGPLAPSILDMSADLTVVDHAKRFVENELMVLPGQIDVSYETIRKFGRFHMENGQVCLDKDETYQEYLDGLSRLWQIGDGFVYVKENGPKYLRVCIYHIMKDKYKKLPLSECTKMIKADPLWKSDRDSFEIVYR